MEAEKGIPSPRGARKHIEYFLSSRRVFHAARRGCDDILIDLFPPRSNIFICTREGGETRLLSPFKCGPTRSKRLVLLRFIVVSTKSSFKRKRGKRKRRKESGKHGNEESHPKAQTRCESEARKRTRTKRRPTKEAHKKHTSSRGKTRECRTTCSICIITIASNTPRKRRKRKRKRKNPSPLPRGKKHPPKERKTQRKRKILRRRAKFEKRSANTGSDGNAFV